VPGPRNRRFAAFELRPPEIARLGYGGRLAAGPGWSLRVGLGRFIGRLRAPARRSLLVNGALVSRKSARAPF
jgi:hypothetical protein